MFLGGVFISGRTVLWASGGHPAEPLMPACPDCISQAPNDPFDSRRRPFSLASCLLSSSMVDAQPEQRPVTYIPSTAIFNFSPLTATAGGLSPVYLIILSFLHRTDWNEGTSGLSCRIFAALERGLFIQIWKHSISLFSGLAWR